MRRFPFYLCAPCALIFLFSLDLFLFALWFKQEYPERTDSPSSSFAPAASYPEIKDIKEKSLSFSELSAYFSELARKKGGAYAFDVLRVAPMPPNIDLHLLGHVVGDVLYKQQGVAGMRVCTNDFRNACSHSIVVGLLFDKGEGALAEIADACRKAPGGSGAYTMCFHGLGHGIVAYAGYNMKRGVGLCEKTGTAAYGNREAIECIGGSVMELIGGGFHDREQWAKQRKIYFSHDEPLAPCDKDFMPREARTMCYTYLSPYLWEAAGADLGSPKEKDFVKSFQLCEKIPSVQGAERDACFGGFGKEFVGLVQGRDIRSGSIAAITEAQLRQIYRWCHLAPDSRGTTMCSEHALAALYWGGENDRSIALRYCSFVSEKTDQYSCFENLIGNVALYIKDVQYRQSFCEEIPPTHKKECRTRLL